MSSLSMKKKKLRTVKGVNCQVLLTDEAVDEEQEDDIGEGVERVLLEGATHFEQAVSQ